MIYTTSQYYNTTDCMTHLFVKITNQMVAACKEYITDRGHKRIWDFPYAEVSERIKNALALYKEYDDGFQSMKNKSDKEFDFSEMYTFGKFVAFCKRLEKIQTMLNVIERYNAMISVKLEGFDPIITKYKVIVSTIQKKGYDFLDQRKTSFDEDFEYFTTQIGQLTNKIMEFAEATIIKRPTVTRCLEVMTRIEKLNIPEIKLEPHYALILDKYQVRLN